MILKTIRLEKLGVTAEVAGFVPADGVGEWHVILHVAPLADTFEKQLCRLYEAEAELLRLPDMEGARYVLKRYFLSDSANQQPLMRQEPDVAISLIQQQPLDGSKIAVWLYLQRGTDISAEDGTILARHNGYTHLWRMGLISPEGDSAQQTEAVLTEYETMLEHHGATLAENCIRTWFFVRDVDTQYAGMVRARRENFQRQGLTPQTHYIASTGIGGGPANTRALVQLGTYALTGFEPQQQRYLCAPTHLNPTIEYGVTFERGTAIEYGDRQHVYISGTASINNCGEVMYERDIRRQTERMWENVEALLAEAGSSFDHVMHLIVYLRDVADYGLVSEMFRQRFPQIPTLITLAPVCRPTWLIEMECVAVKAGDNPKFRNF